MKIEYYIDRLGVGEICSGTPCRIDLRSPITFVFGREYDGGECIINYRRYPIVNGECALPAKALSPIIELSVQITSNGVTKTYSCEPLHDRGGFYVGATEDVSYEVHLKHFTALKHLCIQQDRELAFFEKRLKAVEAKYAELERKLNGTDIFDLAERETIKNEGEES